MNRFGRSKGKTGGHVPPWSLVMCSFLEGKQKTFVRQHGKLCLHGTAKENEGNMMKYFVWRGLETEQSPSGYKKKSWYRINIWWRRGILLLLLFHHSLSLHNLFYFLLLELESRLSLTVFVWLFDYKEFFWQSDVSGRSFRTGTWWTSFPATLTVSWEFGCQ